MDEMHIRWNDAALLDELIELESQGWEEGAIGDEDEF